MMYCVKLCVKGLILNFLLFILGYIELMKKYYKIVNLLLYDLFKVLKEWGVDDLDKFLGFYYWDDVLKLWNVIKEFVIKFMLIYY